MDALRERPAHTWEVLDVQVHGVFYAVLQGSLYVLCYQGEVLAQPQAAAERERIAAQLQALIRASIGHRPPSEPHLPHMGRR